MSEHLTRAVVTRALLIKMCAAFDHVWEKHTRVPDALEYLRQSRLLREALIAGVAIEVLNDTPPKDRT